MRGQISKTMILLILTGLLIVILLAVVYRMRGVLG
jgi:hypothetical protein